MTLGIMQPYLFPYIGYFQYMAAVNRFVLYDDVQFIMRGWIQRNRILVQGAPHLFTASLSNASPNLDIRDVLLSADRRWAGKLLKTIDMAYGKAPFGKEARALAADVLEGDFITAAELAGASLLAVAGAIGLETEVVPSSTVYGNRGLERVRRILDICSREGADRCIVPAGGASLYPKDVFASSGIELGYLQPVITPYPQGGSREFVPSLSVLDVIAWNGPEKTGEMARLGKLS